MSKKITATKKSAIADMQDRMKRGVAGSSESPQTPLSTVKVNTDMASIFGNDPKEIASYVSQNKKRR
jgi:hypothetical protein